MGLIESSDEVLVCEGGSKLYGYLEDTEFLSDKVNQVFTACRGDRELRFVNGFGARCPDCDSDDLSMPTLPSVLKMKPVAVLLNALIAIPHEPIPIPHRGTSR